MRRLEPACDHSCLFIISTVKKDWEPRFLSLVIAKAFSYYPKERKIARIFRDALLGLILALSFFSLIAMGFLVWDRQHTVTFLENPTVFDGWDYYSSPQPKPVGTVEKGTTMRILWKHFGIDSGGIRVRLPDGRLAYDTLWMSEGDTEVKTSLEPRSILIMLLLSGVWLWLPASKKKRSIILLNAAILLLATLGSIFLMFQGLI